MGRISSPGANRSLPRLKQKKSAPVAQDDLLFELEDDEDPLKYVTTPMQRKEQRMSTQNPRIMAVAKNIKNLHRRLGSSPLILFIIGGLVLFFWFCATLVQIQTSEYLAAGDPRQAALVSVDVLAQPWLLITGQSGMSGTAWIYGYGVEVITLVFAVSLEAALHKVSTVSPTMARWFLIGGLILIFVNSYSDYSASPGVNIIVKALIALCIGGLAVVGMPLGIGLIEAGVEEL